MTLDVIEAAFPISSSGGTGSSRLFRLDAGHGAGSLRRRSANPSGRPDFHPAGQAGGRPNAAAAKGGAPKVTSPPPRIRLRNRCLDRVRSLPRVATRHYWTIFTV